MNSQRMDQWQWLHIPILLVAGYGWSSAGAEVFTDYARVVSTQPVVETRAVEVATRYCDDNADTGTMEINGEGLAGSGLATAIGNDLANPPTTARSCRIVYSYQPRQQIVGYRVWYRYQGRTLVRQMDRDPGARLRVLVDLEPAP